LLSPGEKFQIGGLQTLRGYREQTLSVQRALLHQLEYRFLVGPHSYLAIFADYGLPLDLLKNSTIVLNAAFLKDQSLFGYGFGAQFKTGFGAITLNYGLGRGDRLNEGKVHIGAKNQF